MIQTIQTKFSLPYHFLKNLEYTAAKLHLDKNQLVIEALSEYLSKINNDIRSKQHLVSTDKLWNESSKSFSETVNEVSGLIKLAKLKSRKLINGDPDELINIKVWEWNETDNL